MIESLLFPYLLFFAKCITVVFAILAVLFAVKSFRGEDSDSSGFFIEDLNEKYSDIQSDIFSDLMDKKEFKKWQKEREKNNKDHDKPLLCVLDFDGDISASATDDLREQISVILQVARENDQVLLRLESGGGMVHSYGFAASQLNRLRAANIPLTICVDKIAASGGYMMASLANTIVAAPFAILGSVGVIGALPNFNRLLKKHDIEYEEHTAGKFKRSLTTLGENTEADREQFKHELEMTHDLFKAHITQYRPNLDIEKIATGETWYGSQALQNGLIDRLGTSDDVIIESLETHRVYLFSTRKKQSLVERLFSTATAKIQSSNVFKTLIH